MDTSSNNVWCDLKKILKIHPVASSRKMLASMEMIFVFICSAVLISISFTIYYDYIERSRVTGAISLSTMINHQYVMQYYRTGEWRKPADFLMDTINLKDNKHVTEVDYQNKSYTFHLKLSDNKVYKLSFRIAEGLHINWLCGYQTPLAGHIPSSLNETDLPKEYLPIACRGQDYD